MAVGREHGTTGQTAASSLRLFRIVLLHDVETMLRNPSVLVCCVLVVVMGWLFDSVLQFWPWFTCAAIGSLAVGVPTAIGMLVAFAEEHEYGMGETLARVGVARRCRVAAKALAGFALAEVLMCALALSMGLGMRGALLVAALAVPTTAFMALACAALAARAKAPTADSAGPASLPGCNNGDPSKDQCACAASPFLFAIFLIIAERAAKNNGFGGRNRHKVLRLDTKRYRAAAQCHCPTQNGIYSGREAMLQCRQEVRSNPG